MAAARPHKAYLDKAPSPVHDGFAEFIAKTTGHTVPAGDVALALRLYPVYLKSPQVVKAREAEKAAKEREAQEKAEAAKEKKRQRLAQIEEQRQRLLAELGLEDESVAEVVPLKPVKAKAAKKVEPEPEPETDDTDEADDGQVEVTLSNDEFVEADADDDLWGDEGDTEDDGEADW